MMLAVTDQTVAYIAIVLAAVAILLVIFWRRV